MKADRKIIHVPSLARVEGEGGIFIEIRHGAPTQVHVTIHEAPRFFEAFLIGRPHEDVPDFTARICGICPVAYQMSSVHALEKIFGIQVEKPLRDLRRLLYCAEWIESHALHMYLLNGPDFYGLNSAWESKNEQSILARGVRFKKLGNELLAVLGGRSVHPVSVRVGGFTRTPSKKALLSLAPKLETAYEESLKEISWAASLPFPETAWDTVWVSLVHDEEYPMNEGTMGFSTGETFSMDAFLETVIEFQVSHSTALHAGRIRDGSQTPYMVGPLSRLNLNHAKLPTAIQSALKDAGISVPIRNTRMAIVARAVELAYAFYEALRIIADYEEPDRAFVPYEPVEGEAVWITEAPRGSLMHRYRVGSTGRIESCTIIPPTSQNLAHMEMDLRLFLESFASEPTDVLRREAEKIIRCYDPCISCAVHVISLI
ncbi:MAG: nickel-dependent hydrogenase large subunit [Desulfosoma sp.]